MLKTVILSLLLVAATVTSVLAQSKIFIPMDLDQNDHLKAYGITFWALTHGMSVDWLLNYRGGSFMADASDLLSAECRIRGVTFETLDANAAASIYNLVQSADKNMDVVKLEKAPKIAVYLPPTFNPWDDAVTLALEYAEVPYERIWDDEVLAGKLKQYDWLHLHHEDFTGQYGKFYGSYSGAPWYQAQVRMLETEAKKLGYSKVSDEKKAVAQKIKEFVGNGGYMFAMCSATDTYDIALAAENDDICDATFDGDPVDPNCQQKLDYSKTFAFENFKVDPNPFVYSFSDIDVQPQDVGSKESDYFTLFDFSAKYDPVPTMLTQDHTNVIKGFMGQTTAFHKRFIKKSVTILGEREGTDQVKYLFSTYGRGFFTFYAGHDPEDYQHQVGDPATDLKLHKNSPGYRLILNNVLFPAAKKKKLKT
ncbi:MAG: asparagine synthetase B [Bacteroidota bacterium]|nr:asparagine synthetase B [Bacteroidota bacterium]MDP4232888.1 asparagine synthetase B [Bacteroidota bacterium]MDP4241932.1 asparagine synthetase B [Bacteroidota bacterium]MDP4286835.1 asparagine synthetase B [Bacteroidota bacterium]